MLGFAQFMMRKAKIVRRANQVHPGFYCSQTTSSMAAFARQGGEPLPHGAIEPESNGRIEHRAALGLLQQHLSLFSDSPCHLACHFYHAHLLGALDHRSNTQILPEP